jgi:prepilin-type processing-associated H-X9-DG protein
MQAPIPDRSRAADRNHFGSAHSGVAHFAFCDGSVRAVSYQIEDDVMRRLGNRHDGQPVDLGQLGQ